MKRSIFLQLILFIISLFARPATAQITPDGTTSTTVTPTARGLEINNGDVAGDNLFHSFGEFSVPTGSEAFFNNADSISNIFSRVTGGDISNIDGILRANGTANLFLINPAGIVFGEGARLQLGGSFYGSTADSIVFPDGEFSATDLDNPPLITINAPIGFSFRDNPGEIINRANLVEEERFGEEQLPFIFPLFDTNIPFEDKIVNTLVGLKVNRQQNITLVGGNIILDGGGLTALSGKIQLGGLATAGIITIDSDGNLVFPNNIRLGNVSLINDASIDVQGNGGGDIIITGQNIEVKDGSTIFAGIRPFEGSQDAQAGDIVINGIDSVALDGVRSEGTQRGGANFYTNISNNIGISLEKEGVNSTSELIFLGQFDFATNGEGQAGNIEINTKKLDITNGARIINVSSGKGNLGDIIINAEKQVLLANSLKIPGSLSAIFNTAFIGKGDTGNIEINTQSLNLTDGSQISGNIFRGQGKLGNVFINATRDIVVSNNSSIFSTINADGLGDSGKLELTTQNFSLTNKGRLFTSTNGRGNAGDVIVNATKNLIINDGRIRSEVTQTGEGDAGTVTINTNKFVITNEGIITVSSTGKGNIGQITINTGSLELNNQGTIEAESNFSSSSDFFRDNIILNIDGNLTLANNSLISAKATEQADGGNIRIDTDFIIAFPNQNNDIVASAEQGNGGNIFIEVEGVFGLEERALNSRTNDINASSQFGLDGSVSINTLDTNPLREKIEVSDRIVTQESISATDACAAKDIDGTSNLVVEGKGGLPSEPTEPLNDFPIITEEDLTTTTNPVGTFHGTSLPDENVNNVDFNNIPSHIKPVLTDNGEPLYAARGIIHKPDGGIILTAYPTPGTPGYREYQEQIGCDAQ